MKTKTLKTIFSLHIFMQPGFGKTMFKQTNYLSIILVQK